MEPSAALPVAINCCVARWPISFDSRGATEIWAYSLDLAPLCSSPLWAVIGPKAAVVRATVKNVARPWQVNRDCINRSSR